MKVLILGADGYLGWPTALHLWKAKHHVLTVDNYSKRMLEMQEGVSPLVPVPLLTERSDDAGIPCEILDIATQRQGLYNLIEHYEPDAIVHYAEQPSAPYSMKSAKACIDTQTNNVVGTLNVIMAVLHHKEVNEHYDPHIIKLGTMGEYGTPNIDIEEGWLDVSHNGREDRVLYPKKPGSWYHLSKVHDSHNLEFAARIYGLRITDLNQGIVYGYRTSDTITSFHYDATFGTVINRFITQAAVGEPLTVYGEGGQTRGYLNIKDTVECIRLAVENPPDEGEFRIFNQFTEQWSVRELARKVSGVTGATIRYIENPRVEEEDHYYNAKHTGLEKLGLIPHFLDDLVIEDMFEYVCAREVGVDRATLNPQIKWRK